MSHPSYEEARRSAIESLDAGDAREALGRFRGHVEYPAQLGEDAARWRDALTVLSRILGAFPDGDELARQVARVAEDPRDPEGLFDLGCALCEQGLPGMAATVLAQANGLVPGQEPVVAELAFALEGTLRFQEAARVLREAPEVLERSAHCRCLLAWTSLLAGDLIEPRRQLARLDPQEHPQLADPVDQIRSRLARADAVRGVTPLDERDLRGWHFVLTAGLLLHLSPYDLEEGMRGRYCFVQDQVEVCREGVQRAAAVLDAWSLRVERVWVLPDPDSAALGLATGRILGVPAAPWPEAGAEEPGLIVAYDLAGLEDPVVETLAEHRPGQVLWAHASRWTDEPPFAADLTTYLYQCNVSPWGERLALDSGGRDLTEHPPDTRPPEARAGDIAVARPAGDARGDLAVLLELARAGGTTAAATRTQGPRLRQPVGSPVPSSRFA